MGDGYSCCQIDMNLLASRSLVRAVRLADLDVLHPPVAEPSGVGAVPPHSRTPHAIGSTVPGTPSDLGPLSEPAPRSRPSRPGEGGASAGHGRLPGEPPAPELPRLPKGVVQTWPVRFDGTPAGYARVWLGNVLLLLCTLGLAWPWTYRRAQRYLLRHTLVADHRLDYSLPPGALWPRLGITLLLWLGVAAAAAGSAWTGALALTLGGAVWPLLVYLKVQQKVASLTWAGCHFRFDGPWPGLYRAVAASLVLGLLAVWAGVLAWQLALPGGWAWSGLLALMTLLSLPVAAWRFFSYRQPHIRLGPLRLTWKGSRAAMVQLTLNLMAAVLWVGLAGAGVALGALGAWRLLTGEPAAAAAPWLGALLVLALWSVVVPLAEARLLNLVWNKTGNRHLRTRSRVHVPTYVRLYAGNLWRTVFTLGAYWPWAVVSLRALRMRSMAVWSRVDPDVLIAHAGPPVSPERRAGASAAGPASRSDEQPTQPAYVSRLDAASGG